MKDPGQPTLMAAEASVHRRYSAAARQVEAALCCPVSYSADLLAVIPEEVIERDYGCGDPTPFVKPGEVVLDLGSGGGKLCFIAAQVVGSNGRVIGVDCNLEMLNLAKRHAPTVAERLGFRNVDFRYGMIQDLRLNLDLLHAELARHPVVSAEDFLRLRQVGDQLRQQQPLIEDESVDCVVSNCVLNLVRQEDRRQLFEEIFRVLRPGGRAAISDIVSDSTVPEALQRNAELWSGCLSGAFREDEFPRAFEQAGFHGIEIAQRAAEPWQRIEGIDFRSMTLVAYKPEQISGADKDRAVIYRGPFKIVEDDYGNHYRRGERTSVSGNTARMLSKQPYAQQFEAIDQSHASEPSTASPSQQTVSLNVSLTASKASPPAPCCRPGESC